MLKQRLVGGAFLLLVLAEIYVYPLSTLKPLPQFLPQGKLISTTTGSLRSGHFFRFGPKASLFAE